MRTREQVLLATTFAFTILGCDEPAVQDAPAATEPTSEAREASSGTEEAVPSPSPNEACARVIVSAYKGAAYASGEISRSKEEARTRADALRARVAGGEDFAAVASKESDAASSGARGGLIGTYGRDEWPAAHEPLRDPIFSLADGAVTEVIEAPYGFAIAKRCPVEKVHTRHILVRYEGAKNAGDEVTRKKADAEKRARELHEEATSDGADFAALARQHSEDGSAERGGDLGPIGRGRLEPEYEEAAFALSPGDVSDVVETRFGYHIIRREP